MAILAASAYTPCQSLWPRPAEMCSDDIVRWIKKRTGPATVEVADVEALEKAQKENKVRAAAFRMHPFRVLDVDAGGGRRWRRPRRRTRWVLDVWELQHVSPEASGCFAMRCRLCSTPLWP